MTERNLLSAPLAGQEHKEFRSAGDKRHQRSARAAETRAFNAFDNIVETGKDFLGLLAYSPAQSSS